MPVNRQDGCTPAERAVVRLAERAFLRLWSYPAVFRDQGVKGKSGDGKELCDLLVVCGNDLIIFSDKDCKFPESGDTPTRWGRWYKRAVQKSAEQIWGAERWLREHPDGYFLTVDANSRFHSNYLRHRTSASTG